MRQLETTAIAGLIKHLKNSHGEEITLKRKNLLEVLESLANNVQGELMRTPKGSYLLADRDGVTLVLEVGEDQMGSGANHFRAVKLRSVLEYVLGGLGLKIDEFRTAAVKGSMKSAVRESVSPVRRVFQFTVDGRDL